MVLDINSFDRLMGFEFFGRRIKSVRDKIHFDTHAYVFAFDAIKRKTPRPTNSYHCWEDAFNVYLIREPINGMYELYVMGLHGVTVQKIEYNDVKNFGKFLHYFSETIQLCKQFWDESENR